MLGPAPSPRYAAVFDEAWRQFDLHYSFFELKRINWDSLGKHYRPVAIAAQSDQKFAEVLAKMLAELRDVHVALTPFGAGSTMRYLSQWDTTKTFFSAATAGNAIASSRRATSGNRIRYGMMSAAVGYISIPSFEGSGWSGEMDDALAGLPRAKSLIVDVRDNGGGGNELAVAIAGRFAPARRIYGYVKIRNGPRHSDFTDFISEYVEPAGKQRFAGKVFVLTNRRNTSSAENFIMAMGALPGVTVVGDTTGGASGGPVKRELPNGWSYQLSEWVEYTASKRTFEGIGLAPDIVVPATGGDFARGVDTVLELALKLAGSASTQETSPTRPSR